MPFDIPIHEMVSIVVLCVLALIGLLIWAFQPDDFQPDMRTEDEVLQDIAAKQTRRPGA